MMEYFFVASSAFNDNKYYNHNNNLFSNRKKAKIQEESETFAAFAQQTKCYQDHEGGTVFDSGFLTLET